MKHPRTLFLMILILSLVFSACNLSAVSPSDPGEESSSLPEEPSSSESEQEPSSLPTATTAPATETFPPPTHAVEKASELPVEGLVPEASGACYHPYFPIRSDTTWTYYLHSPYEEEEGSYSLSFSEITQETFVSNLSLKDPETGEIFQGSATWFCKDDGLISSDFASIYFTQLENIEFDTLDYEGIFLLPPEQWEIGAIWESVYKINADFTIEGLSFNTDMEIVLENTIAAVEEVTVNAGTFPNAYRVDTDGTITIDIGSGESGTGFGMSNIPLEYSSWYVSGVGMVKQVTTSEQGEGEYIELYSLE